MTSGNESTELNLDNEIKSALANVSASKSSSNSNDQLDGDNPETQSAIQGKVTPNFLEFWQDGSRRSAFSPYTRERPTTILTNLQRGNVKTQTTTVIPDLSVHQLAAQGELLPESEKDLNEEDKNGFTPLMWACAYGQYPTVKMLLDCGVDYTTVGYHGENSLLLASAHGHTDIVKLLLSKEVDVNHADENGNTALIYASFNNHAQCAEELLKIGADITHENAQGDTSYSIAVTKGNKQVQVILEKHILSLLES